MEIGFFPEIHEDELFYSVLARFYNQSGLASFESIKDILFTDRQKRVEIEFLNHLKPEVLRIINKSISLEDLIKEHTMYPYYAYFLPMDKKRNAFNALLEMEGNFNILLSRPRMNKRFLKYCPICAANDINKYGEAIWYRKHQLFGINVCAVHGCKLIESTVQISKDTRISPRTVQEELSQQNIKYGTKIEKEFARYTLGFFKSDNRDYSLAYKDIRKRFGKRTCPEIYSNLIEFYNGTDILNSGITECFIVNKLLTGIRFDTLCMSQLLYYLKMGDMELKKSSNTKYEIYLKNEKKRIKRPDYKETDEETLIRVKKAIEEFLDFNNEKIRRITVTGILTYLDIPHKRIKNLPLCKEEIKKYEETYTQFRCRRIVFAIRKLQEENKNINWNAIYLRTNIIARYREECLEYLKLNAPKEIIDIIDNIE